MIKLKSPFFVFVLFICVNYQDKTLFAKMKRLGIEKKISSK